jgi:hypothetical protein
MLYETLEVGRRGMRVSDLLPMVPHVFIKKILCEEWRQPIKNIEIFLVDNLCRYCCETSQRTGNGLV